VQKSHCLVLGASFYAYPNASSCFILLYAMQWQSGKRNQKTNMNHIVILWLRICQQHTWHECQNAQKCLCHCQNSFKLHSLVYTHQPHWEKNHQFLLRMLHLIFLSIVIACGYMLVSNKCSSSDITHNGTWLRSEVPIYWIYAYCSPWLQGLPLFKCLCHKLHSVISPPIIRLFPRSQSQLKALKKTFQSIPVTSRGNQ